MTNECIFFRTFPFHPYIFYSWFFFILGSFPFVFAHTQELFTWDHGNQLTYPIRYNDMTKYASASERAEEAFNAHIQTGYDNDE